MTTVAHYTVNAPMVVHETIDNEVVIINLDTGCYYSLQGLGGTVWEMVKAQAQQSEIVDTIKRPFDGHAAAVEDAVNLLLEDLQHEQLIVITAPSATKDGDTEFPRIAPVADAIGAMETLKLAKYTDMQEMMLLDPIHDVTETGWPERLPDRRVYVD